MRILVTGGAGYIGSHTCKALAKAGHTVIVYDNLSTGHKEFVRWGDFVYGDIRDTQCLRASLKRYAPDGIIHFAASAYVGESVINPSKYFHNNVCGTLSILDAMRDEGVPNIVVSGTCAVYGQPATVPISEDCPKAPINPYGASKLIMERMLADYAVAHGIHWVSLRYFNAAGGSPDGEIGEWHEPETHLIPRVIMAALGKIPVMEVYGDDYDTPDGTCVRDYIHVNDLARGHILAMEYLLSLGENVAFNLGSGHGASVQEIISGVSDLVGKSVPYVIKPRRAGDPAKLVADATKASDILHWNSQIPLRQILEDAVSFITMNSLDQVKN